MQVDKAFKKLLTANPFYGLFCLSLPKRTTNKIETLAVAKKGIDCELLINPDFWDKHTDEEQIALLTHELSHICFQHMFIMDSFSNHEIFNYAADMEVNSYIDNLPKEAVLAKSLGFEPGKGTKYYYEELMKQANKNNNNNGQSQQSNGNGKNQNGLPDDIKNIDDHSTWKNFKDIPEATKQLMKNKIDATLKQTAEQIEKQRGTIPGELTEIIEKLRKKRPEVFNWKAYFRRLLGSIYDVNIRSTRRKESKRFSGSAGIQHKKKVSMLIAIDTSGSVSKNELQDFFSEIEYIYKAGARITILECDTTINKVTEFDGKNIPEIVGRGGTDFNPPVEYYIKNKREYASMIYFTDGEAPLPEKSPSGMIWIITSNGSHQDFPGKTVYIPKTNNE